MEIGMQACRKVNAIEILVVADAGAGGLVMLCCCC
jgi:hypothetical protein